MWCVILSVSLVKKKRALWKIHSTRGQQHTLVSIGPAVEDIRARFPTCGCRQMKRRLLYEKHMHVSKYVVRLSYNIQQ